jgi:hypothetical protein
MQPELPNRQPLRPLTRLRFAKPPFRTRGEGKAPPLRPNRIVQHVFGETALLLVGVRRSVGALGVAVLAAGDVFGRADLNVVGAAERVVVAHGDRCVAAVRAGRKRQGGECQRDGQLQFHAFIFRAVKRHSLFVMPGLVPGIHVLQRQQ